MAKQGIEAGRYYEKGRAQTRAIAADFDGRIALAEDKASAAKLRVQRGQLSSYAAFPYDEAAQKVLAGLDR